MEDNKLAVACYHKSQPEFFGYSHRMYKHWKEGGGFDVDLGRLLYQIRVLKDQGWFSGDKVYGKQDEVKDGRCNDVGKSTCTGMLQTG